MTQSDIVLSRLLASHKYYVCVVNSTS